jgi:membrane protein involved in colicin uptake
MEDLIRFQAQQLNAVRAENERLKNELQQARELMQSLINEWEVQDAEVLDFPQLDEATKVFDEAFQNPIEQLNTLTDGFYRR